MLNNQIFTFFLPGDRSQKLNNYFDHLALSYILRQILEMLKIRILNLHEEFSTLNSLALSTTNSSLWKMQA